VWGEKRMQNNLAISVQDVTKVYRLYDKPIDRLKEALSPTHKEYHKKFFALDKISFDVLLTRLNLLILMNKKIIQKSLKKY